MPTRMKSTRDGSSNPNFSASTMKIPPEEQYKELKTHLRYLNEKLIEAFSRFITLSIAIIGGVFYVHITLDISDPRRFGIWLPANIAFTLLGIGTVVILIQTLSAWLSYRQTLSDIFPEIKYHPTIRTWMGEVLMCLIVVAATIGFWFVNPLR
jgi:Sec-independent protein secretion pathway component TatC